jgi:preprotein translocase subunit YajC
MLTCLIVLAQADAPQGAPQWTYLMYALPVILILMFFRAQSRQRRDVQKALSALKKNDKVITSGGIIGVVVAIKENEDEVTLKTDDASNSRVRVQKSSITRITTGDQTVGEAKTQ